MAEIKMYIGENDISIGTGQALGFFGPAGFGDPLSLNEFNGRTFVTDDDGSTEFAECDNCRRISSSNVVIGQTGTGIDIRNLPNYLATINLRFTHPQAVLVQNAQLIAVVPTGLDIYGAEIIHTSRLQTETGTGDTSWVAMGGSGQILNLVDSPATSGLSPFGPASTDTRHDWYIALSTTPTLPGDKQFSFQADLEYI